MPDSAHGNNRFRQLKLLFHVPGLVDGGAERVIADLASSCASEGCEVILAVDFLADDNAPQLDPRVRLVQLAGGHVRSLPALARLINRERPDIAIAAIASASFKLVLADLLACAAAPLRALSDLRRPRLVLTYHGFDEYKTGKLSWLGFAALPLIGRYAAKVVAVSDVLRDELEAKWRAPAKTLVRIHNPVAVPAMPAGFDPFDLTQRENLILSVGRLVSGKRFDLLIEALHQLDDKKARLVILGEGPERLPLEQIVVRLGLEDRVSLPGYKRDTGGFLARAKCFALVSERESFGLAYVEALAYGLPVIAADNGGAREVLDHGRYGDLLREPTAAMLRDALQRALTDPGDPAPRIERARAFSREQGLAQYHQLFEQLLAG